MMFMEIASRFDDGNFIQLKRNAEYFRSQHADVGICLRMSVAKAGTQPRATEVLEFSIDGVFVLCETHLQMLSPSFQILVSISSSFE